MKLLEKAKSRWEENMYKPIQPNIKGYRMPLKWKVLTSSYGSCIKLDKQE